MKTTTDPGKVQPEVPRGGPHPLSLKLKVGDAIEAREEIFTFMTTNRLMPHVEIGF